MGSSLMSAFGAPWFWKLNWRMRSMEVWCINWEACVYRM